MLVDLRELPDGERLHFDLCVIGTGAAGLSIAHDLRQTGLSIGLFESGGLEYDAEIQYLYDGELAGLEYYPLDSCRLRYFGGTTNHWSGYCAPFDEHDFTPNPMIPHTGWPIGLDEVGPYMTRAARFIGLPEEGWNADLWAERLGLEEVPLRPGVFHPRVLLIHPTRFGLTLRDEFRRSDRVRIFLHANVVEIEADEAAQRVTALRVRTLEGKEIRASARAYALCAGGIENARLLLASSGVAPGGLGNQHDLVGRFFSDHVNTLAGVLQPTDPGLDFGYFDNRKLETPEVGIEMALERPRDIERREGTPPGVLRLFPVYDSGEDSDGIEAARRVRRSLSQGEFPEDLGTDLAAIASDIGAVLGYTYTRLRYGRPLKAVEIWVRVAPVPNPNSRVTLTQEHDALGLPKPRLEWRLSPADKRCVRAMVETFAAEAAAEGLGRVQVLLDPDDHRWSERFEASYHHMGTTRMADDPKEGVVDRHCRVHGIGNLFVGGSSVFSTPGHGTPTMMIIALAMRLADHLKEHLTS